MTTSNNDIKQKPVFNYSKDHLGNFKYIIEQESKDFLKDPHPVQSKLLAILLLKLDFDENIKLVIEEMLEVVSDLIIQIAETKDSEKRMLRAERSNSLIAIIKFLNDIIQLGLGLNNQISN